MGIRSWIRWTPSWIRWIPWTRIPRICWTPRIRYGHGYGHGYVYGKRSADAEPEVKADPYLLYSGLGYTGYGLGHHLGFAGHLGYGYGLGYRAGYYYGK